MKKEADFNAIAPVYYPLSRLVFGTTQEKAQEWFARKCVAPGKVLVVGAGNGSVAKYFPETEVYLVEPSAKMIRIARKLNAHRENITYFEDTVQQFMNIDKHTFDTVVTGFFFDLFQQEKADALFHLIDERLVPGGNWIFTDFRPRRANSWWQRIILFGMYNFFRLVSNVNSSQMPEMKGFQEKGFQLFGEKYFHNGLIITQYWKKVGVKQESMRPGSRFT